MVFAQFKRETIQRRVTDNYFARAQTGMYPGGCSPFGCDKGETVFDGKQTACYVANPKQVTLMTELFARYLSPVSLVRWLNANGHRTRR